MAEVRVALPWPSVNVYVSRHTSDVVHSMDIAAAVGAERLREIMTDLVNRAAVVVHRYGGTVGSFTGDGIMAVFGAPLALEDHAVVPVWRVRRFKRKRSNSPSMSKTAMEWSCGCALACEVMRPTR